MAFHPFPEAGSTADRRDPPHGQDRGDCFRTGRITVVLLNRTEEEIPVYLRLGEYCAELTSKAKSIMTAEIEK